MGDKNLFFLCIFGQLSITFYRKVKKEKEKVGLIFENYFGIQCLFFGKIDHSLVDQQEKVYQKYVHLTGLIKTGDIFHSYQTKPNIRVQHDSII